MALRLVAAPLVLLCLLLAPPPQAASRPLTGAPVAPELLPVEAAVGSCPPGDERAGQWVFLSDMQWTDASSGWQAIADVVLPERDASFSRNPLVMAGVTHSKGLGTYPLSEATYDLEGRYGALQALLGLNDDSAPGAAAVFLVFADGTLVHNSGPIRTGEPPRALDLCLAGVRELRLVTARAGQSTADIPGDAVPAADQAGAYANWAAARIFLPADPAHAAGDAIAPEPALAGRAAARRAQQVAELGAYRELAAAWGTDVARHLGLRPAAGAATAWPAQTQSFRDADGRLVLAHRHLALSLGFGGADHAALSVLDVGRGALSFVGAGSSITTADGVIDLTHGTAPAGPDAFAFNRVEDPALGVGTELRARLRPRPEADRPADSLVEIRIVLFDDRPYFTYQFVLDGWDQPPAPRRLDYLSAAASSFVVGTSGRYFADASHVRAGPLAGDGLWRSARLDIAKPALVWGDARVGSTVLALLDEQRLPAWLVTQRDRGRAGAVVGVSQPLPAPPPDTPAAPSLVGPRLLVEHSEAADLPRALGTYRRLISARFPPAPLPDWVRYQWGTWYAYGERLDEARIRRQIDLIARYLGDLGPWHLVVDAGWQDIGPDGSGDLRREDSDKFPSGLRALVDYAHARGVRVLLYLAPTYVHDGALQGEWLALHGLLKAHPDWFVRVSPEDGTPGRFLFDYKNPAARDYLAEVVASVVTEYGADGISLDGLGDVEGQLIPMAERTSFLPDRDGLTPVMDVYRLVAESLWSRKPDALIESGWVNPATAHPYAHTFRFGDDKDAFDYGYPNAGLLQHFDYAVVQRALGQRGQVGATFGGFNRPIADQWIAMAMATGGHISLGSDFTFVKPEGFGALRAQLVHYRPFAGETRTGTECNGLCPTWAATTVGELTFVGLMNRDPAPRRAELPLADAGLDPGAAYFAYDVAAGRALRVADVFAADVPAQSFRLFVLRRAPGVFWTTSSYESEAVPGGWRLAVRGPAEVEGHVRFYLPGGAPRLVRLDGRPLGVPAPGRWEGARYDAAAQVLSIQYVHDPRGGPAVDAAAMPPRTIEILR